MYIQSINMRKPMVWNSITFYSFMAAAIKNLKSYLANPKDEINVLNQEIINKTEEVNNKDELLTLKENEIRNKSFEIVNLNEQIMAKDNQIDDLNDRINTVSEKFEKCNDSFEAPWDSDDWVSIQSRLDGSVNFNRSWVDYKNGFGDLTGEFFIGLEKLHQMTKDKPHKLFIELRNENGTTAYALYENFEIGSEEELYKLKTLGRNSWPANSRDVFRGQEGSNFSTFDRDNDGRIGTNCAKHYSGGWWYDYCIPSINGKYSSYFYWFGKLHFSEMMIRPITRKQ